MKKIAVFGKPGSGKSTFSKNLALATGIKLHALDSIVYKKNADLVDRKTYDEEHGNILYSESWIIDGFGPIESFYKRLQGTCSPRCSFLSKYHKTQLVTASSSVLALKVRIGIVDTARLLLREPPNSSLDTAMALIIAHP